MAGEPGDDVGDFHNKNYKAFLNFPEGKYMGRKMAIPLDGIVPSGTKDSDMSLIFYPYFVPNGTVYG
jgi:hypothetical protein